MANQSLHRGSSIRGSSCVALLGLGSNLGNRRATLESAIASLRQVAEIEVHAVSTFIETEPVGVIDQPRFLNGALKIRTTFSPRELLDACLHIEREHQRNRAGTERFGPRTLDIDLLLYCERIIDEPGLHVPHPRLHERLFALQPAVEIAADMVHPALHLSIGAMFDALKSRDRHTGCTV